MKTIQEKEGKRVKRPLIGGQRSIDTDTKGERVGLGFPYYAVKWQHLSSARPRGGSPSEPRSLFAKVSLGKDVL